MNLNAEGSSRALPKVFAALIALICLWILCLPLFPMQDGPMHLYLAHVLGDLLHSGSVYASFYSVQHLLPPYSLHYYLLIALMQVFSGVWAEKIVVCLVVLCFCYGCRFLATAHGRDGEVVSFFSLAIALNWPLMMGFQNYVLSLGIACWTLGVWSRLRNSASLGLRALFVGLCALVAVTHPLPLLLVLGFCFADLTLHALFRNLSKYWRHDLAALAVASSLLLYLRAFTDKRRSAEDFHATESVATRIHYFVGLHGVDFLNSLAIGARLQQLSLYLILGVLIFLALRAVRGSAGWNSSQTWFVVTLLLTVALPFLPDDLSGSKALVSRLQVVTFVGLMAAASGLPKLNAGWQRAIVILALASTCGTLVLCQARLAPIARRIARVELAPNDIPQGAKGILLSAHATDEATFNAVTYEPLHWQAARFFLRTNTVLLNPPWMDSTWLPLTAQPALLTNRFTPWTLECYQCLRKQMVESEAVRGEILAQTDFIIFVDQPGTATRETFNDVLAGGGTQYNWICDAHDWYWLCRKEAVSL